VRVVPVPAPGDEAALLCAAEQLQATVYGVHGATAVVLLATAALLFT
jgi:hypothetical protein